MSDQRDEIKKEIAQFRDEHLTEIDKHSIELKDVCMQVFQQVNYRGAEDFFDINVYPGIQRCKNFLDMPEKTKEIKSIRKTTEDLFKQHCLYAGRSDKANECFSPLFNEFERIISYLGRTGQEISKVAKRILKEINDCPHGEAENRSLNAKRFERNVIELIQWTFIDEMERIELSSIEDGSLERDAGFEVVEGFDTKKYCGFEFTSLIVECKNYRKPSYKDLMQLFTYTLPWTDSEISKNPLCLLVNRENPKDDSVTWKIRKSIFNKPMGADTRLILFLDTDDLQKMIGYREKGHPANIFKEKIQEFKQDTIKNF